MGVVGVMGVMALRHVQSGYSEYSQSVARGAGGTLVRAPGYPHVGEVRPKACSAKEASTATSPHRDRPQRTAYSL